MSEPVVITGLGPLTADGRGREAFRELLWSSQSQGAGGEASRPRVVADLSVEAGNRGLRHVDRLGRLALAAAGLGIDDAGLRDSALLTEMGVAVGSGLGCLATNADYLRGILAKGPRLGNPIVFQNTVSNAAAGYVSSAWKLCGPTSTFCSGAVAGLEALDFAVRSIAEGDCDGMLVITAEELSPWLTEAFSAGGELSPSGVGRPLDLDRDGVVLAEGACALVVESKTQALRRGARVYAEVLMPECLAEGYGLAARDETPSVVFAGASGSPDRDRREARGLSLLLGEAMTRVPVSCPKGALGETLGSSAGFGVAAAALALWLGDVPPTANLRQPDPGLGVGAVHGGAAALQTALVSILSESGATTTTWLRRCAA